MVRSQTEWAQNKVVRRVEKVQQLRDRNAYQDINKDPKRANRVMLPKGASLASQPQLGVEVYAVEHFYSDYGRQF